MNTLLHDHVIDLARGSRGGFASKLADAWLKADSGNQKTLNEAFPHLFRLPTSPEAAVAFVESLANLQMPALDRDAAVEYRHALQSARAVVRGEVPTR
jgi:hypothetical protein